MERLDWNWVLNDYARILFKAANKKAMKSNNEELYSYIAHIHKVKSSGLAAHAGRVNGPLYELLFGTNKGSRSAAERTW